MRRTLHVLFAILLVAGPTRLLADGMPPVSDLRSGSTLADLQTALGGGGTVGTGSSALDPPVGPDAAERAADRHRDSVAEMAEMMARYAIAQREMLGRIGELASGLTSLGATVDALAQSDRAAAAEWESHVRDGPQLPVSCQSDACQGCYRPVIAQIDRLRMLLITARTRASATVDLYKAANRAADAAASMHNAAGAVINSNRAEMLDQPIARLKSVYVDKAGAMLGNLEAELNRLGECEARYYRVDDWYGRFGFMYMSFMRSKYETAPE